MPQISVIVPVYNVQPYLKKCIDSILNQTFKDFELILVDDGSKDECPHICDGYANKYKNVIVIHKENGGLSSARNVGLSIARGNFVTFVDSDDYVAKTYLSSLFNSIKNNKADVSICNICCVNPDGVILKDYCSSFCGSNLTNKDVFNKAFDNNGYYYFIACAKMYSKQLLGNDLFKVGKIHEDEFFLNAIFFKECIISIVEDYNYFYYKNNYSITSNAHNEALYDGYDAAFERLMLLKKKKYSFDKRYYDRTYWIFVNTCKSRMLQKETKRGFFIRWIKLLFSLSISKHNIAIALRLFLMLPRYYLDRM